MVDTEVSRVSLVDRVVQIAEMHDAQIDRENLRKTRAFLEQERTPCGHKYMGSVVKLNFVDDVLDKITVERPYQIRDVHDTLITLTETFRVYSRAKS